MKLLITPREIHAALPRDYWHVKEPTGRNFAAGTLRGYYIDMRAKARDYQSPTQDGIPLRNQNREGLQLLPVTVSQQALGHYEIWLISKDPQRRERFLHCADWLVQHHTECPHKMDGWSYFFDHGRLGIKAPFISAMGQGQGISVLVRAHQLTQHDKYLSVAKRALEPFNFMVDEGGVTARTEQGGIYFEEYPCQPYSHILNGHIFALWGLYDYAVYQQDKHARQLFDQGTATLIKFLPRYDLGFWSRYGLFPHPMPNVASPFYHELHIAQMHAMHQLTGLQDFGDFAARWEAQFNNWFYFVRAVAAKVRFKTWVKARKKGLSRLPFIQECSLHAAKHGV